MYNAMLRVAYLALAQRQIIVLWSSLMGAVTNLILNFVLIPHYGAAGAAITGVATQLVALHASNVLFGQTRWLLAASVSPFIPGKSYATPSAEKFP